MMEIGNVPKGFLSGIYFYLSILDSYRSIIYQILALHTFSY